MDHRYLSKTISHALRHEPWLYELELDSEGWTDIDVLISSLRDRASGWADLTRDDIAAMIANSEKVRHEIQGHRIRALYGHSIPGKLKRSGAVPPELLFHGTSPEACTAIRTRGLQPMARQYVHLSLDRQTAREVGLRKSPTPVILEVAATVAQSNGVLFYEGNEKVWLADAVPPEFIDGWP